MDPKKSTDKIVCSSESSEYTRNNHRFNVFSDFIRVKSGGSLRGFHQIVGNNQSQGIWPVIRLYHTT